MAALVRCRVLFQSFRCQTSIINGVCRSDNVLHTFLNKRSHCVRPAFNGGVRLYSSEVKSGDDLIVRYLDGDDSGRQQDIVIDRSCVGYRILVGYVLRLTSVTQKPLSALPHNSTVSVPITARQCQSFVLYKFLNLGFNICSFTLPQHIFNEVFSFFYIEFLVTFRDCFCCHVTCYSFFFFNNAVHHFPSIC